MGKKKQKKRRYYDVFMHVQHERVIMTPPGRAITIQTIGGGYWHSILLYVRLVLRAALLLLIPKRVYRPGGECMYPHGRVAHAPQP